MENSISPLQRTACLLIRLYQIFLSPVIGRQCRFFPTCSEYTREAIIVHGFFYGCLLGIHRIIRCVPFLPGGFDPVPDKT